MKKFLFATILVLILYSVSVSAEASFNIVQDSVSLSGQAGDTVDGSFTVDNTGTTNLDINFTDLTLFKGADELSISSLNNITGLTTGASVRDFFVVIPSDPVLGVYTGIVTAANGSLSDPATIKHTITINVDVTPTFSVSTDPSTILDLGPVTLNSTKTSSFDITNTGTGDLTNIFFTFSDTKYSLTADKSNFTLAIGAIEQVGFTLTIPKDSSTGNLTLGSIQIDSTELDKTLFDVKAQIAGGLIIEDLDVFLTTRIIRRSDGTYRSENGADTDVSDGQRLNFNDVFAGPGSELRFNFNIENTFKQNEEIDIEDITVEVLIEDIDDGENLEEESDEFDVDSGRNEEVDVFIIIPLSVIQSTYDVVITVEGEDENGNSHTAQMNLRLKVDKNRRDLIISEASLFPNRIICSGTSTLTATIKNLGVRIEDDAELEIVNSDLGINYVKRDIELDEDPFDSDNEFTHKLTINIDRETEPKTYPIEIRAYVQDEILWETKIANLEVEACTGQVVPTDEPEEEPEEEQIDQTEPVESVSDQEEETTEGQEISLLGPATTTEIPLTKNPGFWIGIFVINIIIIAVAAFFIVKAVGRK